MERIILHIDMDAFFASIEQRDNPNLRGKPIVVGGEEGNKGVVSTASYEARKFGIHSAMPIYQAKKLYPKLIVVQPNFIKYAQVSVRILNICHLFTPIVEPVSIDEFFLDISGTIPLFGSKREIAESLQKKVLHDLELSCSIGIAPNKLLAKIASDQHKPAGITIIQPADVESFLANLPIEKIPGIGDKTAAILRNMGIRWAGEIGELSQELLRRKFGKLGIRLYQVGKGIDDTPVIPVAQSPRPKSIGKEVTLSHPTVNREMIRKTFLHLTNKVAFRLRKDKARAHTITLKVKFDDLTVHTINHTVEEALEYEADIFKIAISLFNKIDLGIRKIRLLGIRLSNLEFLNDPIQLTIFSLYKKKFAKISLAIDKLKQKYGEEIISIGE
ncbi:MAG: DNA polymerase IV [Candidatus Cloacimonadia bacterium]